MWLFDGNLQAQPDMPAGLPLQVIEPPAGASPLWVQDAVHWARRRGSLTRSPPGPRRCGSRSGWACGCFWCRRARCPGWPVPDRAARSRLALTAARRADLGRARTVPGRDGGGAGPAEPWALAGSLVRVPIQDPGFLGGLATDLAGQQSGVLPTQLPQAPAQGGQFDAVNAASLSLGHNSGDVTGCIHPMILRSAPQQGRAPATDLGHQVRHMTAGLSARCWSITNCPLGAHVCGQAAHPAARASPPGPSRPPLS